MAFTRFHDDPSRISKSLQESVYSGDYYINTPGPGVLLPMQNDAQLRMQYWGANIRTNTINLESDLKGMTRTTNWHHADAQDYRRGATESQQVDYPNEAPFTEDSRASHPAWMYRDLPHDNWSFPILNPQNMATIEPQFFMDIQTRLLQRDHYYGSVDDLMTAKPNLRSYDTHALFPVTMQERS